MATITDLQRYAQRNYGLDYPGALRQVHGLDLDPDGIAYEVYGVPLHSALDDFLSDLGGRVAVVGLNGGADVVSTPDATSLDLSTDFEIRFEGSILEVDGNSSLITKFGGDGDRAYLYQITGFHSHDIAVSEDGSAVLNNQTAAFQTFAVRPNYALRATFDADDGAGNRVAEYYYGIKTPRSSTIDGATNLIETVTTAGAVTGIFNSTAALVVGGTETGDREIHMHVERMEVYDGINGTLVANPDFRYLKLGTTSFVDSVGLTWTFNGNAHVA